MGNTFIFLYWLCQTKCKLIGGANMLLCESDEMTFRIDKKPLLLSNIFLLFITQQNMVNVFDLK